MYRTRSGLKGAAMHSANRDSQTNVGIRILDCDHREMSETIKDIHADLLAGKDRGQTLEHLKKLALFAGSHFAMEEEVMSAAKYEGLHEHSLRHERMEQQIQAFLALYNRGAITMDRDSVNFVRDWNTIHVGNDDKRFDIWLRDAD